METSHVTLLQCCEDNLQAARGYTAVIRSARAAMHAEGHQLLALLHNVMYCAASRKSCVPVLDVSRHLTSSRLPSPLQIRI